MFRVGWRHRASLGCYSPHSLQVHEGPSLSVGEGAVLRVVELDLPKMRTRQNKREEMTKTGVVVNQDG